MKENIIIISILAIILVGDITAKKYLYKTSDEIISKVEDLKQKTIVAKETKEREKIIEEMSEIDKRWKEVNKVWSTIVVHQELDNVEQALIKAKSNIENGELEDALQEIETSKFFLEHIKDREKLCLKNIL